MSDDLEVIVEGRGDDLPPIPAPMSREQFLGRLDRAMLKVERVLNKTSDPCEVALVARSFGGLARTYSDSAGFKSLTVEVNAPATPPVSSIDRERQQELLLNPEYRALICQRDEIDQAIDDALERSGLPAESVTTRAARRLEAFREEQAARVAEHHRNAPGAHWNSGA